MSADGSRHDFRHEPTRFPTRANFEENKDQSNTWRVKDDVGDTIDLGKRQRTWAGKEADFKG
jgi:hypothetical protein